MLLAAALLAATAVALVVAPNAAAGTYKAVQCHGALGAGRSDATYSASSKRYVPSANCTGSGLGITHDPGRERTAARRFGAWSIAAPKGTTIVRATASVSAFGAGWHAPQVFLGLAGGARRILPDVRGEPHLVRWAGRAARAITARLVCTHASRCGAGRDAHIHLRRVALMLRDAVGPSIKPSGAMLNPGSRRGLQTLTVAARDTGSGVRALTLEVNDDPLASKVLICRLTGPVALRLRPCPATESSQFDIDTTSGLFRQGPNRLRVCAADYAPRSDANRVCTTRPIRIDNLCPVSDVPGATLQARFRGGGARLSTRSDRPAVLAGGLSDAAGGPIAGARVCLAASTRGARGAERVLAVPTTSARGTFSVRIPPGPSRRIRVAHWPSRDRALETYLTLESRAVPRLRLRPRRALTNGERVRFRVRLPAPASGRRRVVIQARAGRRWVRAGGGRTSGSGAWRGSYRFNSTTGTRRYAFRAVVPRQPGYPYERGRSRIAHATVVGSRTAAKSKPG
jgi:hypothetical protein